MSNRPDVVITGIGVVSPIGVGVEPFWTSLVEGKSGIGVLSHVSKEMLPFTFGGQLTDFDPKAHVRPRKTLKVMCRELQTAFASSMLAIEHSGLDYENMPAERMGTVFGSEMLYGDPDEIQPTVARSSPEGRFQPELWGQSAMREVYPLWMLKYLPNMAACHVGIAIGAHGPNNTIVMGDTSGLSALGEAVSCIERGIADVVVACSTGTRISHTRLLYRGELPYASERDPLSSTSRPYAADRDGTVGGEGSGAVVLESKEHAQRRGATPLARIAGFASNYAAPPTGKRGSATAVSLALQSALQRAGRRNDDVGIVVGHATGDPDLDREEAEAIASVTPSAKVTAPKGAMGHAGAGCGIIELAAATMALSKGVVPPTLNADQIDSTLQIDLPSKPTEVKTDLALQFNHTASGHAVAVALATE